MDVRDRSLGLLKRQLQQLYSVLRVQRACRTSAHCYCIRVLFRVLNRLRVFSCLAWKRHSGKLSRLSLVCDPLQRGFLRSSRFCLRAVNFLQLCPGRAVLKMFFLSHGVCAGRHGGSLNCVVSSRVCCHSEQFYFDADVDLVSVLFPGVPGRAAPDLPVRPWPPPGGGGRWQWRWPRCMCLSGAVPFVCTGPTHFSLLVKRSTV